MSVFRTLGYRFSAIVWRMAERLTPNCRAIIVGFTPALTAALIALALPWFKVGSPASVLVAAAEGGARLRGISRAGALRVASAVTTPAESARPRSGNCRVRRFRRKTSQNRALSAPHPATGEPLVESDWRRESD